MTFIERLNRLMDAVFYTNRLMAALPLSADVAAARAIQKCRTASIAATAVNLNLLLARLGPTDWKTFIQFPLYTMFESRWTNFQSVQKPWAIETPNLVGRATLADSYYRPRVDLLCKQGGLPPLGQREYNKLHDLYANMGSFVPCLDVPRRCLGYAKP
jgi:hypothetical protein